MRTGAVNSATHEIFEVPDEEVLFADRHDAGRRLAAQLERFRGQNPVVVAIPRGGVPVAAEIASALGGPLDVIMVRKIGAPWQPEYAIGAVAEGGVRILAERELSRLGIGPSELDALVAKAEHELAERSQRYRGQRAPLEVKGRTVLLVDDGWRPGARRKRRRAPYVSAEQHGSCSRYRWRPHSRYTNCPTAWTRSSRCKPPRICSRSGSGTATSVPQPTKRSQRYWQGALA